MATDAVKEFCSTFDPQYLDLLEPYHNDILDVAYRHSNTSLGTIVINHFNKVQPRPLYISGIGDMVYLEKDGQKIYLLYGMSPLTDTCPEDFENTMSAADWVMSVIKTADVFLDIFLEIHPMVIDAQKYTQVKKYMATPNAVGIFSKLHPVLRDKKYDELFGDTLPTELSRLTVELYNCYSKVHETKDYTCPYHNIRVHFTDFAGVLSLSEKVAKIQGGQSAHFVLGDVEFNKLANRPDQFVMDYVKNTRIAKQYESVDPVIRDKIFSLLKFRAIEYSRENYLDPTLLVSDAYLLGRLLRSFSPKDPNHPSTVKNAIVYVDSNHASICEEILVSIGFKRMFVSNRTEFDQCVDISELPYPLFR